MQNQIVVFELGTEHFGLDLSKVENIIKMQSITRPSHIPSFVEGVTSLRGKILPVIDLRKRFGLGPQHVDKHSRIIVVCLDQMEIGMIVDQVSEVTTVPEGAVKTAPTITSPMESSFITGIAKLGQRLVMLLDLNHLLSNTERFGLRSL
jgi:purine-binding chemotaxis protein CheW